MRIETLWLHQYKKFAHAVFSFHPSVNILIGENAAGKTSVLEALSVAIGTYLMRSNLATGRSGLSNSDIRVLRNERHGEVFEEPQLNTYIKAKATLDEQTYQWKRTFKDRGGQAKKLIEKGLEDRRRMSKNEENNVPVLLYYGSNRLWSTHKDTKVGKPESRRVGYRHCLDPRSDHRLFEKWFKRLEYAKIQKSTTIDALEVVRQAVITCIGDVKAFYFDIPSDQLMIQLETNEVVPFNLLSDGYRNMVGMVADIAHRMFRLNPHLGLEATSKGKGVVLIDEIDLHLHPKWQRSVVGDLIRTFPDLQFIATTHSAIILQSLEPGQVIDLENLPEKMDGEIEGSNDAQPAPSASYSNSSPEDIYEKIMDLKIPQRSLRYQEMYEAAKEYYRVLQQAKGADEEGADEDRLEALKLKLDALSAPFSENVAYHAFLEMERLAAGVKPSSEEGGH